MRIAIAGATGNVGREIIRFLEGERFEDVTLLASSVSAGESIPFKDGDLDVQQLSEFDFTGINVAIFATAANISAEYVQKAIDAGAKVVDLSAQFRTQENVPLVAQGMAQGVSGDTKQVSCPDSASFMVAKALSVLADKAAINRVTATVMYPISAAGKEAMDELFAQSANLLGGVGNEFLDSEYFPVQVAYNVLPKVGDFTEDSTTAEVGMVLDVNRLMNAPVPMGVTAVHVPTFVGTSAVLNITFSTPVDAKVVREALFAASDIHVLDEPENNVFSTPFGAAETDGIYVSRIRNDVSAPNSVSLWVVGDNMAMAAQNAVAALHALV